MSKNHSPTNRLIRSICILSLFMKSFSSYAQVSISSILNTTGSTANKGSINLEWNIGESVLIHTATGNGFTLSQGLLQGYRAIKPTLVNVTNWQADDIKIYPNPAYAYFIFELFSSAKGEVRWTLIDNKGTAVTNGYFDYYGEGRSERIDISNLSAGIYYLKVTIKNFNTRVVLPFKEGGFKIIKLNQ